MTPLLDARSANPREGGPSFALRHRLTRLAWAVVWNGLGKWTPVPFHGWRRLLLCGFGASIHRDARIYPGVKIWYPANLSMDAHACLSSGVNCYSMDKITLGAYALVSQGAYLCGGTHDVDDPHFQLVTKPITIGANAWIAADAFVGPGVVIADGAVLGARGVTFKNLEANSIYAGNPARFIRHRKQPGIV
ncbi:putative colanic acid biosynthesis acetyltransferase [Aliirhizobium terrae]|uniref:putative colanic acid biosynthesis acetyltransferase n=1 Tax=Terrirhizobium terrae TaxID=2926709 RepID=UPI0025782DAC|nr:putative colanic acid biosynthesis acetyltransferase [Rhizobium sp. CC-CFT758]WJH39671.1 putative colanic acid biosynthesis acetyltransferase [Rhizobium sp. CC-CFT758]